MPPLLWVHQGEVASISIYLTRSTKFYFDFCFSLQPGGLPPIAQSVVEITADELAQIKAIARIHDINYKSINFGKIKQPRTDPKMLGRV